MKLKILAVCFLLLLASCSMSADQLSSKVANANSNVKSYSQSSTINMDVILNVMGSEMKVDSTSEMTNAVDRAAKKASMTLDASSQLGEMKANSKTTTIAVDNKVYSKKLGSWETSDLSQSKWMSLDQLDTLVSLMQAGSVELMTEEEDHYVVKVTPSANKLAMYVLSLQSSDLLKDQTTDLADAVKSMSLVLWVNDDTFLIERANIELALGFSSDGSGKEDVSLNANVDAKFSGHDRPVTVNAPI